MREYFYVNCPIDRIQWLANSRAAGVADQARTAHLELLETAEKHKATLDSSLEGLRGQLFAAQIQNLLSST